MNSDAINRYTTTVDYFLVVLDSRNSTCKQNGSFNSNMIFDFQDTIKTRSRLNKMKCSVLSFTCPNSIYTINETNNILSISINGVNTDYYIELGNYNARTFISTLLSILPTGFSISLNNINNKFTITYTLADFTINATSTVGDVFGFSSGISYTSVLKSLTLPDSCNFNGLASLNISVENLNTNNYNSFNKSPGSIIQPVTIQSGAGQITYYKTNKYAFDVDYVIDYLQINIQDDLGNYINFNGKHWNLTLCFECLEEIDKWQLQNGFYNILENPYNY